MRLMLLNQAPLAATTSAAALKKLTNQFVTYASPGTEIEYHFVEDFAGAKIHEIQGKAQRTDDFRHTLVQHVTRRHTAAILSTGGAGSARE
jgi:hypothetical protein